MKKVKTQNETPRMGRHRLFAAASMLVIAAILLTGVTFAWLTLSLAPEVTGISTQIGANGSLEIALLNAETRGDLSKIRTSVGSSLANNKTANNSWGNLVDVNAEEYGLSAITLMPARLNIEANPSGGYSVADNYLLVPTYGYDGRITNLSGDTYGMTYGENGFMGSLTTPDFGVRGIGTSSALSMQGSALVMAKTNVITYTNSAKNAAVLALNKNADDLFNLVIAHTTDGNKLYNDDDKAVLTAMMTDLETAYTYVDLALRQGILAHAAANINDEDLFNQARSIILDTSKDLSTILNDQSEAMDFEIPAELQTWITNAAELKNSLNTAHNESNALTGGSYTWSDMRRVMDSLMNLDNIYVGEKLFGNMTADDFSALLGTSFEMTLAPGSGILADFADFTDDYSTWINAMGSKIEITTLSTVNPAYLVALSSSLDDLTAASGSNESEIKLSDLYGYALDLAFRCNAPLSDLLLQTGAISRISRDDPDDEEKGSGASTMGAGSYMEFSTDDDHFTPEQMITLMDAVRVAFLDDMGNVLGIAKLNTSNRTIVSGVITAPLYLYNFTVEYDEESNGNVLVMGERRSKDDNAITALDQNVAKAVTTLVWLDGDIVDNTMVSAEAEASLTGILNLQFASSANLVPAENGELIQMVPDKKHLNELLETNKSIYENGQLMHTTESWDVFAQAYEYAEIIYIDANSTEAQVYKAMTDLALAAAELETTSLETLKAHIDRYRDIMGRVDEVARYVVYDAARGHNVVLDSYTQEQEANRVGEIDRVNDANNLKDDGNGVMNPIYTDVSWNALANALYEAEALYEYSEHTDAANMDAAITALEQAYETLTPYLIKVAYEFEDKLYYFAISEDSDTYGKWYDSDNQLVTSDLMIIKLDANAEAAKIAEIEGVNDYLNQFRDEDLILRPYIQFKYPELTGEDILAIQWSIDSEDYVFTITPTQKRILNSLIDRAHSLELTEAATAAEELLARGSDNASELATMEEARIAINTLLEAIESKEAENAENAEPIDPNATSMTEDQRTVLDKAIAYAKTVNGYEDLEMTDLNDETKAMLNALRAAVANAETLLATDAATMQAANDALDAINAQLTVAGLNTVTEYNTIVYKLPAGFGYGDLVYDFDESGLILSQIGDNDDRTGHGTTIKAVVLTKSGVLFTVEKEVQIYAKATGLSWTVDEIASTENTLDMMIGETAIVEVAMKNATYTLEGVEKEYAVNEHIDKCTWSSANSGVVSVSVNNGVCTLNAGSAGTTQVTVSVETVEGNTYVQTFTITVTNP